MLYTFAGIIMLRKCLLIFFNELVTSIVLIIIVLGTNYTLHSSMFGQGSMTHNYLFTLYAFILWFTIRWHEEQKLKYILGLAISSGLAVIVRPSEMICLIIPVVWGVYSTESFNEKIKLLIKNKKQLFFFSFLFVAICFIQLTYWKIYSGSSSGVCVEFDKNRLLQKISGKKGFRDGKIKYKKMADMRKRLPKIDELPFIKRYAFKDEKEHRIVYEDDVDELKIKYLSITPDDVERVVINPWINQSVYESIKSTLRKIDGFSELRFRRSTVVENDEWKEFGSSSI